MKSDAVPPEARPRRLFFALWPEPAVQEEIRRHCKGLLRHAGGRPVAAENLHITLAFLGTTDADQQACVERAADAIALPPFTLTLDQTGHWPRPRVLWLGASEQPPALLALAEGLRRGAIGCGLRQETRPYHAHLTLARKVSRAPADMACRPLVWPVDRFALVASETRAEGAQYTPLRFWPLRGEVPSGEADGQGRPAPASME